MKIVSSLYTICYYAYLFKFLQSLDINQEVTDLLQQYNGLTTKLYQNLSRFQWEGAMNFSNKTAAKLHILRAKMKATDEEWYNKMKVYKNYSPYLRTRLINLVDSIPIPQNSGDISTNLTKQYFLWKAKTFFSYYLVKPVVSKLDELCDSKTPTEIYLSEELSLKPLYDVMTGQHKTKEIDKTIYQIVKSPLSSHECLYKNYKDIMRNKKALGFYPKLITNYEQMISYYNQCCSAQGYAKNDDTVNRLLENVINFYTDLHAYAKYHVKLNYDMTELESSARTFPLHLTGNVWGGSWTSLIQIINNDGIVDYEREIDQYVRMNNVSTVQLTRYAEEYWVTLGFKSLPENFWTYSQIKNVKDCSNISIKDSISYNMHKGDDIRMVLCADPSYNTWHQIFHNLGHLHYYIEYENLPLLNQKPTLDEFEEIVGDLLAMSALNPNNTLMKRIFNISQAQHLSYHMNQALRDLPAMMNLLAIKSWRQKVWSGQIQPSTYNSDWWNIVEKVQGLHHPDKYKDLNAPSQSSPHQTYFDAGLNYHISRNNDIDKYWRSILLKYQLYKGLWNYSRQAHNSNVEDSQLPISLYGFEMHGNVKVGEKLRHVMRRGNRVHWRPAIHSLSTKTYIDVQPMLDYFNPLIKWLKSEIQRLSIPVDWKPTLYDNVNAS